MAKHSKEKVHLVLKRQELIWALRTQEYNGEEIAFMFNLDRSVISRILKGKPMNWKPKWRKIIL